MQKDNKSLSWRKNKATLDSHIESLTKLRRAEEKVSRLQRTQDARKRRFFRLREDDREMYQNVFEHAPRRQRRSEQLDASTDPHERLLDAAGVRMCAVEVGLGGIGSEEHVAILSACEEAAKAPHQMVHAPGQDPSEPGGPLFDVRAGVSLYTFACSLVPSLRKALHFLRAERLEDLFAERDLEQTGKLGMEDCCQIVLIFAGRFVDAAGIKEAAADLFAEDMQQEAVLLRNNAEEFGSLGDVGVGSLSPSNQRDRKASVADVGALMSGMGSKSLTGRARNCLAKAAIKTRYQQLAPSVLSIEQLGKLVDEVCQSSRRKCHQRERQLQEQVRLDDAAFAKVRPDLPLLMKLFQRRREPKSAAASSESSAGGLTQAALLQVLLEFGLRGAGRLLAGDLDPAAEQQQAATPQHGERLIGFRSLLAIVEKCRSRFEELCFKPLQDDFMRFAATESRSSLAGEAKGDAPNVRLLSNSPPPRYIPLVAAAKFIEQTRCFPRRRDLPDAVTQAVEEHLTYSTEALQCGGEGTPIGTISFHAMVRLLQRIAEQLGRADTKREIMVAVHNGFQAAEVVELKGVFEGLDTELTGTLDKLEVWEALKTLELSSLTNQQFEAVFRKCDPDKSGRIGFEEFIELLGVARDRVGAFSSGDRTIIYLSDLQRPEVERVLGFFGRQPRGSEQAEGRGAARRRSSDQDNEPPSKEQLQDLCECLGLGLGVPLEAACGVETVQQLFAYALGHINGEDSEDYGD